MRWPLSVWVLSLALASSLGNRACAEDPPAPEKPRTDGRPVLLVAGRIVVYPEGMEDSPKDYIGSIGVRPFALITIDEKIVGEVYAAPLKKSPQEEAKELAGSPERDEKIKLLKRSSFKVKEDEVEVVTLHMDLKSKVGTPWIFHSLYLPRGEASTTFKLVASEENFETLRPYFETMLFLPAE
jgi:hypothetical protein